MEVTLDSSYFYVSYDEFDLGDNLYSELRVKIGHHKIGACAELGQNRIRGGWGVKKTQKTSDIISVRSLILNN